ncbi:hypothetical protein ACFY1L_10235 [Streptomyces sp. NPDC001663]|uniref:hypothetical protein n=1 Tax=Streptomyces sp. NPDC001663 TaxID=3364597 RepID=UPI0036BAB967
MVAVARAADGPRDADLSCALPARWRPWSVRALTVSALIMLGDAVRDALDPKLR